MTLRAWLAGALTVALGLSGYLFPCAVRAQVRPPEPFTFTKIDLKLLEEVNAADRQLETRGLVWNDAALEKHLADNAAPLLPAAPLENVTWRFHVLRDPLVNAFALPNGSV